MKKDEFLSLLEKKLQVINEKERRDIIDEYRTHIEMKIRDGKSEEEAIEDFGDIDELVDDILDAYKINTDKVHQHDFDKKFNNFMDELYDGFQRFVSSFTSLAADDVIKLIFECFIILIFLWILRIPFDIIASIGSSLLRSTIGFGLGGLWELVIHIAYLAVFVIVLVDLFRKRIYRYKSRERDDKTVFDDFKSTMHEFANGKNTYRKRNDSIYDDKDDVSFEETKKKEDDGPYEQDMSEAATEKTVEETPQERRERVRQERRERERQEHRDYRNYDTYYAEDKIGGFASGLMKIFFCLLMIPFVGIIVALSCALGAMVVLSVQGFTLFGAYFILIGSIMVTSAFLSALYRLLWRRGRRI